VASPLIHDSRDTTIVCGDGFLHARAGRKAGKFVRITREPNLNGIRWPATIPFKDGTELPGVSSYEETLRRQTPHIDYTGSADHARLVENYRVPRTGVSYGACDTRQVGQRCHNEPS
jgi:hypothetical protein